MPIAPTVLRDQLQRNRNDLDDDLNVTIQTMWRSSPGRGLSRKGCNRNESSVLERVLPGARFMYDIVRAIASRVCCAAYATARVFSTYCSADGAAFQGGSTRSAIFEDQNVAV